MIDGSFQTLTPEGQALTDAYKMFPRVESLQG
jgi:hypothetical protein